MQTERNQPQDCVEPCDMRFKCMEKLGEGTYGVVYKAEDKENHNEVSQIPKCR